MLTCSVEGRQSENSFEAELFNCSDHGNLEGVMAALEQGSSVGYRSQGFTPLLGRFAKETYNLLLLVLSPPPMHPNYIDILLT